MRPNVDKERLTRRFINAAKRGDVEAMTSLRELGVDVDDAGPRGATALARAAACGQLRSVRWLLEQGADIERRSRCGWTALFAAVDAGFEDVVAMLLNHGANVDTPEEYGETPLARAARRGHTSICKRLIDGHANLEATGLHLQTSLTIATINAHVDIVRLLLRKGANPNGHGGHGRGALFDCRNIQIAELLVRAGAEVNPVVYYGWTPIMMAAARGDVDVVRYLIECRADVNKKDDHGRSVLAFGRYSHTDEIVRLLVRAGAKE